MKSMSSDVRALNYVRELNRRIKSGWSAHLGKDGRLFYCNHGTQTASWLPPSDNWDCEGSGGLPYGWEAATDKEGKQYYINHVNKTTTYEDPRKEVVEEVPQPREVELIRDQDMGFGFVAGSEKPVIVRFVTEGGPSVDKLLPGDQVLKINGEDVKKAPREHVIELVRSCKHSVVLTVCQPQTNNTTRKSALLSAAKKAKLKSNPSRVRFAEGVVINGSPLLSPSSYSSESCIPFMPNVLKVFLENGQTKSFKYDSSTAVQDVLESLQQKLSLKCAEHFSLVVEHIKSIRRNKLTLLDPKESLARIAARPSAQHLRCLFRVAFVPKDAYDLLRKDPISFEYLYMQCCNDVVQERFAPELKYDVALRLAALHIQQHALSNNIQGKLSVKTIERECGLERFVPVSLVETMKRKELRKLLSHFLKLNQSLSAPGQKSLTALQAKLHYLKIISELPSYGAKCFTTNVRDSNMETMVLVSPRFGISQIPGIRNSMPLTLADIEEVDTVLVFREDELSHRVDIQLKDHDAENIVLSLEDREADELVLLLQGYYRLLTEKELPVHQERDRWADDAAPPYHTQHRVQAAGWSYPGVDSRDRVGGEAGGERDSDLSSTPTYKSSPQKVLTANGHVPCGGGGGDKDGGIKQQQQQVGTISKMDAVVRELVTMDRNMNKMASSTVVSSSATTMTGGKLSSPLIGCAGPRGVPPGLFGDGTINRNVVMAEASRGLSSSNGGGGGGGFDFQSVVSMEMLEDSAAEGESENEGGDGGEVMFENASHHLVEAKNDEVIRRVTEMQHIVQTAEKYLTGRRDSMSHPSSLCISGGGGGQSQNNTADAGGLYGEQMPRLKAADSLLLLTQVGRESDLEAVQRLDIGRAAAAAADGNEPASGSDTDSIISTPNDSPSHHRSNSNSSSSTAQPQQQQQQQRRSVRPPSGLIGSSFGLHSPDNLPVALQKSSLQELLRRLQLGGDGSGNNGGNGGTNHHLPHHHQHQLPYPFADGAFYLDPDIIDLTMIPPPITPDREGLDFLPMAVSMPPTPFADRQTLEAELRALEVQFQGETLDMEASSSPPSSYSTKHTVDKSRLLMEPPPPRRMNDEAADAGGASGGAGGATAFNVSDLPSPPPPPPQGWGSGDIDNFIASVSVPPPPPEMLPAPEPLRFPVLSPVMELTTDDISAFIIPPPPASSSSDSDTEIISRLQEAAKSINEVVGKVGGSLPGPRRRTGLPQDRFVLHLKSRFGCSSSVSGGACGTTGGTTTGGILKKPLYFDPSLSNVAAGDSSGYDTQTSSIVSFNETREQPEVNHNIEPSAAVVYDNQGYMVQSAVDRLVVQRTNCSSSLSDNASTISGGSSTASGGTQADTEDSNAEDSYAQRPTQLKVVSPQTAVVTVNGLSSPMSTRDESASSESEDAGSVYHHSASSSEDGHDPNLPSPFHRQMSIPRSMTSPLVAKRSQWAEQASRLQRSQSMSTEHVVSPSNSGVTSPTHQRGSPKIPVPSSPKSGRSSSSSGENVHPRGLGGGMCGGSPTRQPANSDQSLVMEKNGNTGTILKSPHMSPSRSKSSVKPPLPPSPTQDMPRRVLASSVDVKRPPVNGTSSVPVPKPVLPKNSTPRQSPVPSASPKRGPSPDVVVVVGNGKLGGSSPSASPTHHNGSRTSTPNRSPTSSVSKLPRPNKPCLREGGDNRDLIDTNSFNGTDSGATSPTFLQDTSCCDIFNFAPTAFERNVSEEVVNHEAPLQKAEVVVGTMVSRLDEVLDRCGQVGQVLDPDPDKLVTARDGLVVEARRFVTASKLFVKSATESEEKLLVNLGLCVTLLDRMLRVTEMLALNTASPLQTQNLALKVRDVAATFVQTTRAAAAAVGKSMNDPSMNVLMQQATTLAAVLTALMRTLRAFNP